ncbi:deoxynucleoside triphosphate triphosphohydrolase SAMHD1 isoform X3 [Procambarus clarkii]|uniref:deoxynucleoside triphosphate triphosphohydrolase SAMHD1 isoform X3 n=1 Tax=Procambarus clarkii TaxID=6728 RepID=UPI003743E780
MEGVYGSSTWPSCNVEVEGKVFNDAVHGAITLPPLCVRIIDTPQFQRLRFLKQLGSCFFVYPSAAHNRFEHSLGVCHLAGQLVRAIQSRQPELKITNEDVLSVEVAGLCHDLGHGPFSHLWEEFVKKSPREKEWSHEEASKMMFEYLVNVNNLNEELENYGIDIQNIKKLMCGIGSKQRQEEKAFLYEIVANKRTGVDVDKWDYFLRDGHNLGIKVNFDYNRLVKFSRAIKVDGEWQICVRDKECNNLYNMFHARERLHRTAYQHRVVKVIDSMLIDAFLYADEHIKYRGKDGLKVGGCVPDDGGRDQSGSRRLAHTWDVCGTQYALRNVCNDMSAYTNLVDNVFHRILLAEGEHPDIRKAKEILENVLKRKLYVYVGQTQHTEKISEDKLMDAILNSIPTGSSLKKNDLGLQVVKFDYGLGKENPVEYTRFYSKNFPNDARAMREEEISSMLPQRFQERRFRLIYKSYQEKEFNDAEKAFKDACQKLNMQEPSVDSWPSHLPHMMHHHTSGSVALNGIGV